MDFELDKWSDDIYIYENVEDIEFNDLCLEKKSLIEIKNFGNPIHLLVGGRFEKSQGFLVGFGGAISNRDIDMKPPYFSFLSVANQIESPYLLISDSTLYQNDDIKIGWYTGHESNINFQKNIANIIDMFSFFYNSRPTLTGGSGGGFAALAISTYLHVNHNIFVWNPQTDIAKYVKIFVDEYLNTAFSSYIKEDFLQSFSLINQAGFLTDVTSIPFNIKSNILYLQNYSDWHTKVHTKPYLENHCGFVESKNNYYQRYYYRDSVNVLIANWGHGHIPPPKEIINYVLLKLITGHTIAEVSNEVINGFSNDLNETKKGLDMFDIKITTKEKNIFGEIVVDSYFFEKSKYEYAFYLFHNDERVDIVWYKNKMDVEFNLKEMVGDFHISAFIKDISHGNVRAFKSKKITIVDSI